MQSNDDVFKENVYWWNNMSFKKETEKIVLLQVKGLIHIIVKFRTKKNCVFLSSPTVILLRGAPLNIAIGHEALCSNKGTNWKFIFPWRKINWHVLQIPKAHFSYLIWLMICRKSIIYAIFIMVMHACTKSLSKQCIQNKLFTRT